MKRTIGVLCAFALLLTGCGQIMPGDSPEGKIGPASTAPVPPKPKSPMPSASVTPTPPSPPPVVEAAKGLQPPMGKPTDCKAKKCVALTFDDGPGPRTEELVSFLKTEQVPATFFMIGNSVDQRRDLVQMISHVKGMTIANHTISHADLKRVPKARVEREISKNSDKLKALTEVSPKYFRPPYGSYNNTTLEVAKANGLAVMMWNVDTEDWKSRNADKIMDKVKSQTRPGAIILMHDIHPTTVDTVPRLIKWLHKNDYVIVSLDNLLGNAKPGQVYFGAQQEGEKK